MGTSSLFPRWVLVGGVKPSQGGGGPHARPRTLSNSLEGNCEFSMEARHAKTFHSLATATEPAVLVTLGYRRHCPRPARTESS